MPVLACAIPRRCDGLWKTLCPDVVIEGCSRTVVQHSHNFTETSLRVVLKGNSIRLAFSVGICRTPDLVWLTSLWSTRVLRAAA